MYGFTILNLLFICSRNQWRSPTGELVWAKVSGVNVRSAGTSPRATRTVTAKDIEWADLIFMMEQKHKTRLKSRFPIQTQHKKLHTLDIPDDYQYGDAELVDLIRLSTEHLVAKALR